METTQAQKDAEALRYRTQVRLALVVRTGESMGHPEEAARAKVLHQKATEIDFREDLTAKLEVLREIQGELIDLERRVGINEATPPMFPKWVRFAGWTLPGLGALGLTLFVLERRRRFKEIDAAAVESLERASDVRQDSQALGALKRRGSTRRADVRAGTDRVRKR